MRTVYQEPMEVELFDPGSKEPEIAVCYGGTPEPSVWLPDLTGGGYEELGADRFRGDLSRKLVSILPMDAVKFIFNDIVDRSTFRVALQSAIEANTLSIRYMDSIDGKNLSGEEADVINWVESNTRHISDFGQYVWESENVLVIGPPRGGWPNGKFIRFEFDSSISDDAGNTMIYGQDQVIIASVASAIFCTITEPSFDECHFPWESGDTEEGELDDFILTVSGTVEQRGAAEHVRWVVVTATSSRGVKFSYRIAAGDIPRDELHLGAGGSRWTPLPNYCGEWSIRLPLQHPLYDGEGVQAVIENLSMWTITAAVITANDVWVSATNTKVVYHEVRRPSILLVKCPQLSDVVIWSREEKYQREIVVRGLRFTRNDLGYKQFIILLDGDFDEEISFHYTNTYLEVEKIQQHFYWFKYFDSSYGRVITEVHLPVFIIDSHLHTTSEGYYRNKMLHYFTFSVRTRAGFSIYFSCEFFVDTLPLDIDDAYAVPVLLPGMSVGGGGMIAGGSVSGGSVSVSSGSHSHSSAQSRWGRGVVYTSGSSTKSATSVGGTSVTAVGGGNISSSSTSSSHSTHVHTSSSESVAVRRMGDGRIITADGTVYSQVVDVEEEIEALKTEEKKASRKR